MGYDDRREILERLEALERMLRSGQDDRGDREHERRRGRGRGRHRHEGHDGDRNRGDDRHGHRGGRDSDEKRIIDTIVRLVSERVGRMMESQQQERSHNGDEDGNEKRIVDLVVGLVAEKVQEIVSTELDRRFDRSETPPVSLPPPPRPSESD